MGILLIEGGKKLIGSADVHGAKNAVLPILAATILNGGINIIHNCPDLRDVQFTVNILKHLGCRVTREGSTVIVDSSTMSRYDIPDDLMREMRSSIIFLGAILARTGRAKISYPGGCELGPRPIDLHLSALKSLGADIISEGGSIVCRRSKLEGREISLSLPSVGATENVMLLACACEGTTKILNAACEPEIEDLQNYLRAIGVNVSGAGGSAITIENTKSFKDAEHIVMADRIVAATYLCAAAMAGGHIVIKKVIPEHLSTITTILEQSGCDINIGTDYIDIARNGSLKSVDLVRTSPYPGFPTDAQAQVMAVMTAAAGTTVFVENIFENRYRHVPELIRMGANIKVEGKVAVVCGVDKLYGAQLSATDLRGGAAMVIAALGAEGKSEILNLYHLDRGYYELDKTLKSLGADIVRTY